MNRQPGKLVYSTRWFEEDEAAPQGQADAPADLLTIEIVIHDQARDERLNALAQRPTLFNFLKNEARSRVYA